MSQPSKPCLVLGHRLPYFIRSDFNKFSLLLHPLHTCLTQAFILSINRNPLSPLHFFCSPSRQSQLCFCRSFHEAPVRPFSGFLRDTLHLLRGFPICTLSVTPLERHSATMLPHAGQSRRLLGETMETRDINIHWNLSYKRVTWRAARQMLVLSVVLSVSTHV